MSESKAPVDLQVPSRSVDEILGRLGRIEAAVLGLKEMLVGLVEGEVLGPRARVFPVLCVRFDRTAGGREFGVVRGGAKVVPLQGSRDLSASQLNRMLSHVMDLLTLRVYMPGRKALALTHWAWGYVLFQDWTYDSAGSANPKDPVAAFRTLVSKVKKALCQQYDRAFGVMLFGKGRKELYALNVEMDHLFGRHAGTDWIPVWEVLRRVEDVKAAQSAEDAAQAISRLVEVDPPNLAAALAVYERWECVGSLLGATVMNGIVCEAKKRVGGMGKMLAASRAILSSIGYDGFSFRFDCGILVGVVSVVGRALLIPLARLVRRAGTRPSAQGLGSSGVSPQWLEEQISVLKEIRDGKRSRNDAGLHPALRSCIPHEDELATAALLVGFLQDVRDGKISLASPEDCKREFENWCAAGGFSARNLKPTPGTAADLSQDGKPEDEGRFGEYRDAYPWEEGGAEGE